MLKGSCHCGKVNWTIEAKIDGITACNCTVCRRYGCLWAYGHENVDVKVEGETKKYVRGEHVEFHFCPTCACITHWRGIKLEENGLRRSAVNTRLANDPAEIMNYPIDHFDGFDKFDDLPRDGRCVKDMWF